jgi:DNA polymerase I-like protein with 3'-5' exonuclease and polymerase domains
MWRSIYVAEQDALWGSLDFSQQEPRLAVHTAVISGAQRIGTAAHQSALVAAQRYWDDRTTDAHTMFTQMVYGEDVIKEDKKSFKQKRDRMKNIFLGLCYGMGGPKLCRSLGLPTVMRQDERSGQWREVAGPEGQALIDLVDQRVPYVRATAKAVEKAAKAKGYIVTVDGRHCHFPKDQYGNWDYTHKAFNRAIQGGAAGQTKKSMVDLDRAGAYLQLQIHDEFAVALENREQGERYARIMEEAVPLKVPSKVDVEVGPSWGEAR